MPGGKGGLDIWRTRISDGVTMGVENLGEPINTPGNEMFPTFRPNGDLCFSSDGHPGMGGLDIFIARIGDDLQYHITHPGYPLNSQADDFGMTFEGNHNRGYFSSSRGDGRGYDHIYWFENPEVVQTIKGWIYEQDGYELNAGEARIVGTDGTNERLSVKSDGSLTGGTSRCGIHSVRHMRRIPEPQGGTYDTAVEGVRDIYAAVPACQHHRSGAYRQYLL